MVHPPFRWQRKYAGGFAILIDALEDDSGIAIAVENMFPVRTDRFFGKYEEAAGRMRRRGGGPGAAVSAFATSIDPTDDGFANYTLDLSHAATAGADAIEMLNRMGGGLRHLHLTDGSGAAVDEHLVPGDGSQPCVQVCKSLAAGDFSGSAILEVTTSSVNTKAELVRSSRAHWISRERISRGRSRPIGPPPDLPMAVAGMNVEPLKEYPALCPSPALPA